MTVIDFPAPFEWGEPIEVVARDREPLKTTRSIAVELGVTEARVRGWARQGCPHYKIAGATRFMTSEVRAWRAKREKRAHPATESNGAIRLRRPESGSTGRGYRDRREYMRRYNREWLAKRRATFFADKRCAYCGAAENLELHHRDPLKKVSHRIWSWSAERREAEIAKCDVVCRDCHMRRHGKVPGGRHGGKHRYEAGCRCDFCIKGQRDRDSRKPSKRRP